MAKIIERLEQKQCELAQPRDKAYYSILYLKSFFWHQASKINLTN